MNSPAFSLRAVLFSLLTACPILAFASTSSSDRAAELLARTGRIAVANVGPHVEHGTYLIQVAVKLGSPSAKLPDGTWLYDHFRVDGNSAASGTLVVRFDRGRVSDLSLVTPAVALAMMNPSKPAPQLLAKVTPTKN